MCLQKFQQPENLPFNQFSDPQKRVFHGKDRGFVVESTSPPYIWIHLNPTYHEEFFPNRFFILLAATSPTKGTEI